MIESWQDCDKILARTMVGSWQDHGGILTRSSKIITGNIVIYVIVLIKVRYTYTYECRKIQLTARNMHEEKS